LILDVLNCLLPPRGGWSSPLKLIGRKSSDMHMDPVAEWLNGCGSILTRKETCEEKYKYWR